jgi:hypothetical protein
MKPEMKIGTPIAIKAKGSDLILWYSADDETIVRFACKSEQHAEELVIFCHRAFGMRTKENSFTTGLLHRDLVSLCSL